MQKKRYSLVQISVHWTTALLFMFGLIIKSKFTNKNETYLPNVEILNGLSSDSTKYLLVQLAILVIILFRFYVRVTIGTPELPSNVSLLLKILSKVTHYFLYISVFLMSSSALVCWYFDSTVFGNVHYFATNILIALILFHICAAFFQEGILGNKILQRIIIPDDVNKNLK